MKTNKQISKEYSFLTCYECVAELRKVRNSLREVERTLLSEVYRCSDFLYDVENEPHTIDNKRLKQYTKSFQTSISNNISKLLDLNARVRWLEAYLKSHFNKVNKVKR